MTHKTASSSLQHFATFFMLRLLSLGFSKNVDVRLTYCYSILMKSARFMSRDDFNMTGVNEGDLPTPPSNDSKNDPPVDIEAEESSSDFNIIKPCRGNGAKITFYCFS